MNVTSTLGSRRVVNDTDISFDGTIDAWNIKFEWYGASLQLPPEFTGKDRRRRHLYMPKDWYMFMHLDLVDYLPQIKYGIIQFEGYIVLICPDVVQITQDRTRAEQWYGEWFGFGLW